MRLLVRIFLIFSFCLILFSVSVNGQELKVIETNNLKLVSYSDAHEYIVPHLVRCFENTSKFYKAFWDYEPYERTTMFLEDFADWGNAGATAVPFNYIGITMSPFSYVFEVVPTNERMNWLMNHEQVHVIACDQAAGSDRFFRKIFGGKPMPQAESPLSLAYSFMTSPRRYSPRWYHEGIAVFMETWTSGGIGRVLSAYYEMIFRTLTTEGAHIYDIVGLESEGTAIDFQVGANSYLYGTRFFSYLAYRYGPDKLINWVSRKKGSKMYFAAQFKIVFGMPLNKSWQEWINWEKEFQKSNLGLIKQYPVTPSRPVTDKVLGSMSRGYYDPASRKMYAAVRYPGQVAHIAEIDIDTGKLDKISIIKGSALYFVTSLAYDQSAGKLFFSTDNSNWRDLNEVDIKTKKVKRLITDLRAGSLVFNKADKSLWGVRHANGISTVIKINPPYKEWNAVHAYPYGTDIFDIDISPEGTQMSAAITDISGNQKLVLMNVEKLLKGDASSEEIFDFENNSPSNFEFTPDGKYLLGTSYYTGVSNIFRFEINTKKMEVVSNAETGFFRPQYFTEDSILTYKHTSKGFSPVVIPVIPTEDVNAIKFLGQDIVEKYPVVKTWMPGSPAAVELDSITTYSGIYNSWKHISLRSAYPVLEGYKDHVALGYRFNFSNKILFNSFDLTASYNPNKNVPEDERFHFGLNYNYWSWKFHAGYNYANFYDLFGPTKQSMKGYFAGLEYEKFLIFDEPRTMKIHFDASGYGNLERLPDFQNISASYDKLFTGGVRLDYSFVQSSLGAVDEEMGYRLQIVSRANYVNSEYFPRTYVNFDYGIQLPVNHFSLWMRSSFGHSYGDRNNVFANFYFGSFGNNWVDYLDTKRYRQYYSFPGLEINELGGKNFGKAMLELTLPPLRFRKAGFVSLYCNWVRMAVFSSGIITNFDKNIYKRKLINFGGQVDFRIILFSQLNTTLSLGYASAAEKGLKPKDEFMVSLKIM